MRRVECSGKGCLLTHPLLRRGALAWGVAALMACGPAVEAAEDAPATQVAYDFVTIEGQNVAWSRPEAGLPLTITYALVEEAVVRPGARNCPALVAPADAGLDSRAVLADLMSAMKAWEAGVNVVFVPAAAAASADLLIGMQAEAEGIAYTDLEVHPHPSDLRQGVVTRSAICFSPLLDWEVGTFDGDPATPNIFYVALHELGHVLGLDHVLDRRSLMTFRNLEHLQAPHPGDLAGVQALYGLPRVTAAVQ